MERHGLWQAELFSLCHKSIDRKKPQAWLHKKKHSLWNRCITCEKTELEKIEEICADDEDENKKKKLIEEIRLVRYIGESSRSAYERGFEHLDKLASLNSKSHMLRHILDKHERSEFSEVQWRMFKLEYKRTAFERQIQRK